MAAGEAYGRNRFEPLTTTTTTATAEAMSGDDTLEFRAIYDAWFDPVCRWLRAFGGPSSDVEDLAQEVFLVVRRKLHRFDGANLAGWLYRIAARTASDARRRAWFKHLFAGRDDVALEGMADSGPGPGEHLERKEAARIVYGILDRMSEKRRRALVLAELEGYTGDEIAQLEGIPLATARTRLHHARREFVERVARMQRESTP